jgi:hypothetical protein
MATAATRETGRKSKEISYNRSDPTSLGYPFEMSLQPLTLPHPQGYSRCSFRYRQPLELVIETSYGRDPGGVP